MIQKRVIEISLVVIAVTTSYLALQKFIDRQYTLHTYEQAFQDRMNMLDAKLLEVQALQAMDDQDALEEVLEQLEEAIEQEDVVQPRPIIEINTQDALRAALHSNKQPSVVFFHMDGCGWCKKMLPVFEQVASNKDFAGIQFYNVDGRSAQAPVVVKELFNQQISGYPFFLFIDENGFIDKHAGFAEQDKFENKIKGLFPALFPNYVAPKVEAQKEQRAACGQAAAQKEQAALPKPDNVQEIQTQKDLEEILKNNKDQSIVFFHMNGCGWCKKMAPVFYAAAQNKQFASFKFYTVDGRAAQAPMVVKELYNQQINGYPFLLFINADGYVDNQSGFSDQDKFENKIKDVFMKN